MSLWRLEPHEGRKQGNGSAKVGLSLQGGPRVNALLSIENGGGLGVLVGQLLLRWPGGRSLAGPELVPFRVAISGM